ncbi:MAG: hypothetical protein IKN50_04035, partial [Clostridia bacterium]|nr:hypothetical protein [Clostridia bacterium]
VGRPLVEFILRERKDGGAFSSLDDFALRCSHSDLNRRQYEMLVKSGALDTFGINRNALLAMTDTVFDCIAKESGSVGGQIDLMSLLGDDASPSRFTVPDVPDLSEYDKLRFEKESLGVYVSGNLIGRYSDHISKLGASLIGDVIKSVSDENNDASRYNDGDKITVAGIVTRITNKKTKKGDPMSFVSIEDSTGEIECIMFSNTLAKYSYMVTLNSPIAINGTVSVKDDDVSLIVNSVVSLEENDTEKRGTDSRVLYIKIDRIGSELYNLLHEIILCENGAVPVIFYIAEEKRYIKENGLVTSASDALLKKLRSVAGDGAVVLK